MYMGDFNVLSTTAHEGARDKMTENMEEKQHESKERPIKEQQREKQTIITPKPSENQKKSA